MTRLLAEDRAAQIWGSRVASVDSYNLRSRCGEPQWWVTLTGDDRGHGFDCNGHVTCDHADCQSAEDAIMKGGAR